MKNQLLFKASLCFLIPAMIFGNNLPTRQAGGNGRKHTEEKTIKKEFRVNAGATLKVDNSYGDLNISTWDENRIIIEVHITTSGRDAGDVREKLDDITVEFNASPNMVSAETYFDGDNSGWFDKIFNGGSVSMDIDYLIKMPITNNVDLNNDYGSINLGRLEGRATINCDYGQITTKELLADNNSLNFDYTDNCYFEYVKSATINADYSGFSIAKAEKLNITADYTNSVIEKVEDVVFNCDYGNIEIKKAGNIRGNGDYLNIKFGEVQGDIDLEADYGSIDIDQMMENAGDVDINSDYTGIDIGISPGYNFDFSIDLEYANLDAPDGFEFSKQISDSGDKYYEGFYGGSSSGNSIVIESDYGNVEFNMK